MYIWYLGWKLFIWWNTYFTVHSSRFTGNSVRTSGEMKMKNEINFTRWKCKLVISFHPKSKPPLNYDILATLASWMRHSLDEHIELHRRLNFSTTFHSQWRSRESRGTGIASGWTKMRCPEAMEAKINTIKMMSNGLANESREKKRRRNKEHAFMAWRWRISRCWAMSDQVGDKVNFLMIRRFEPLA